ncbi:MAG TPA: hypothetical protein VHA76_01530 [Solirubrobacterales bacterium]|nr:hypothetical protein [Solirubrobacterales bacterium]
MRTLAPRRLVAPLLITAALAAPTTAAAAPNSLRHDLARVNAHLRIGLEYGPEELGESMRTAKFVCELGRDATARSEPDAAAADWATLDQVIQLRAVGSAHRIDTALANADSVLSLTGRRYGGGGSASNALPARKVRHWIAEARHGLRIMLIAVQDLSRPFESWRAHECAAASRGITEAFTRGPTGMELINDGMLNLWRLSAPAEGPTERNQDD